ncbi:DUF4249 domain-containing protein [Gaetbulibacter sp. M240]|uniref:DUF4249 family protein n=1 Tax=Gaetbulibacter sp. M240 TaxID=3126511 RepID=UPI00374FA66F
MNYLKYILLFVVLLSCEEVVTVNTPTEAPRLVIDASLNWFKGTDGSEQEFRLSLTSPYFNDGVPPATGAQITVRDSNNTIFNFIEEGTTGTYRSTNFVPILNQTYTITIIYDGETYTGTETLLPVASIEYVEQKDDGGFSGDETELKAFFTDPADEVNYNFFEFISDKTIIPDLSVYKDEFTNGNLIFGFYSETELNAGDLIIIRNYGISEQFYNFMFVLLQQNSQDGGGPFETQPATVRGNCINETNPEHYPLGYFRASQVDEFMYTVE